VEGTSGARTEAKAEPANARKSRTEVREAPDAKVEGPALVLLRLQRAAGNAAVSTLVRPRRRPEAEGTRPSGVQRVHVDLPGIEENILQPYDQSNNATADLEPHKFSVAAHYDLSRTAGAATVGVKIKFVQPDGSAIPDADPRRKFANDVTAGLVATWNGRFELSNVPLGATPGATPAPSTQAPDSGAPANGPVLPPPVALPVNFTATPVFDASPDNTMALVHLHPPSVTADATPGKRIDAGNWFMSKGAQYPAAQEVIAAHEYGHLIGIPDEYSQSNPSMHALLHQATPGGTASADKQLDDAGTKAMVLAALQPALKAKVDAAVAQVTAQVSAGRPNLVLNLSAALKEAVSGADFAKGLASVLDAQARAGGKPDLTSGAADELVTAAQHVNTHQLATSAANAVLTAGTMRNILDWVLGQVIQSASRVEIPIKDAAGNESTIAVQVNVSQNVGGAASGTTAVAGKAQTLAAAAVGTPKAKARKGGRGALPALNPNGNLLAVIADLPKQWVKASGLLTPRVGSIRTKMMSALSAAPIDVARFADHAAFQAFEPALLSKLAGPVATDALIMFMAESVKPAFQMQIDAIAQLVQADIDAKAAGKGLVEAAKDAATSDARILSAVDAVDKAIKTLQQPGAAVPAAKMAGAAAAPTDQNVSYTIESTMGDNNASSAVRPEYLQPVADQFNKTLKQPRESNFDPRLAGSSSPTRGMGDFPTQGGGSGGSAVG